MSSQSRKDRPGSSFRSSNGLRISRSRTSAAQRLGSGTLSQRPTAPPEDIPSEGSNEANLFRTAPSRAVSRYHTLKENEEKEDGQEDQQMPNNVWVDPQYFLVNPWYGQDRPATWGLARPIPHSMRVPMYWGLDGEGEKDGKQKDLEKGEGENEAKDSAERRRQQQHPTDGHPSQAADIAQQQSESDERARVPEEAEADAASRSMESPPDGYTSGMPGYQMDMDAHGFVPLYEGEKSQTPQDEEGGKEKQHREDKGEKDDEGFDQFRNLLGLIRAKFPNQFAEFLATAITIFLGLGANLAAATSNNSSGNFETQSWGWGLATMVGVYVGGGISGACLNPAVTIVFSLFRGLPWRRCVSFIIVQVIAAIIAGGLAWFLYRDAIYHYDPSLSPSITGKAFYTVPQQWASPATAFFSEFIGTAILMCVILALGDDSNTPPPEGLAPLIIGLVVLVITMALSYTTGPALNPARDIGPRLVCLWAGYEKTFSTGWWAYGPWGGAISGAIIGAMMYDTFIFVGGESPLNYRMPNRSDIANWKRQKLQPKLKPKGVKMKETLTFAGRK